MNVRLILIPSLLTACQLAAQQLQINDPRFQEIRARRQSGQKLTEEDRDYAESLTERANQQNSARNFAAYAKEHPARESVGLVPIDELGKKTWEGQEGGLYPGGINTPPPAHWKAGLALAAQVVPLDRQGKPSPTGRIVMCSIGMSNTTQESRSFIRIAANNSALNPNYLFVDCSQGAQTASKIKDPNFAYWNLVNERLRNAEATPAQVQVIWLKEANGNPKEPVADYARALYDDIVAVLHNLHDKFPNLKLVYLSDRIYGGYAGSPLNPEPYAYSSGFVVKRLIASQIARHPELNYDPARGEVKSPWIAWGPRLWADGMKPRSDGLVWKREDLGPDGTHPSLLGREKVANLLMAFLRQDPTSRTWFLK